MTRKDFELIAHGLRVAGTLTLTENAAERYQRHFTWAVTVGCIADQLATTNARFNRDTFLAACGYAERVEDFAPIKCRFCGAVEGVTSHAGGCSR